MSGAALMHPHRSQRIRWNPAGIDSAPLGDSDALGKETAADLTDIYAYDVAALEVSYTVASALVFDDRTGVVGDRSGTAALGGVKSLHLPLVERYRVKLYHACGSIDVAYGAA